MLAAIVAVGCLLFFKLADLYETSLGEGAPRSAAVSVEVFALNSGVAASVSSALRRSGAPCRRGAPAWSATAPSVNSNVLNRGAARGRDRA